MLNKNMLRMKHMRLTTMYLGKLLNSILNKKVEGFFMVYKKMKFLEDVELQRKVFYGPLTTLKNQWARKVYGALHKLRIFNNIVNNYEYHIQPFQKRSIKNNIIGLLREMKLNNHRNQRVMLRDPKLLKNNLLLHITDKLINGKAEQQIESFFNLIKGQDKELTEAAQKFKRFEFLLRGMIRNRYALFFRDFVIHDRSVMDDDNRSHFSRFTRATAGRRQRTHSEIGRTPPRGLNKTGVFGENDPLLNNALSFENKGFRRGMNDPDSNRVINSFSQNDGKMNSYLKRSIDPNNLDYSAILDGSNINDLKRSILRRNPAKFLCHVLKTIFLKKQKQIFEYIKLLLMLKRLRQPMSGGQMTKSIINLRQKVNKEKKLSIKLLAIIVEKIMTYRIKEIKRDSLNTLKDKEVKIFKVLFGNVKSVKPIINENMTQYNPTQKSMINSNSYVNFQRPSHMEHLSTNSKFLLIKDGPYNRMIKSQLNPGTMDFYSDAQNMQMGGMRTSNYLRDDFPQGTHFTSNKFMNHIGEIEESYHRRNMTHRPGDFRVRTQTGKQNRPLGAFPGKNSSVSMHNLNNFGYLKESGSIKVQKNRERRSIFR